ncbi:hypothetical protein LXL04_025260 [Taraxacum kok-saghyz]
MTIKRQVMWSSLSLMSEFGEVDTLARSMSFTAPNSKNIPPDLKDSDRGPFSNQFSGGFSGHCDAVPASTALFSRPFISSGTGDQSMETSELNLKNSQPSLTESIRGAFFSFCDLVKSAPATNGNAIPVAELIDSTPLMSTVYTDSINRVSNLVRKFEKPKLQLPVKLNVDNPVIGRGGLISLGCIKIRRGNLLQEVNRTNLKTLPSILGFLVKKKLRTLLKK